MISHDRKMEKDKGKINIRDAIEYVREARMGLMEWRNQAWEDCQFRDGEQWTTSEREKAIAAGLEPLTINKIFPAEQLLLGLLEANRQNIIAKGRTSKDTETAQIMTEAIAFIMDQNNAEAAIARAFGDEIIAGIGYIGIGDNPDPRQESVMVYYKPWTDCWYDPFGDPYLNINSCKYFFTHPYINLDDLIATFPDKEQEIKDIYNEALGRSGENGTYMLSSYDDEAFLIEERKNLYSLGWAQPERKRVRPVQMYYTAVQPALFAIKTDGEAVELSDRLSPDAILSLVTQAKQIIRTHVKKMYMISFLADLILEHKPTPYDHDEYPIVPFVAYLDRYNQPYGIVRNIREQNKEINKRRTMMLAMLKSRRIMLEYDAVANEVQSMQDIHDEANRLDGFMVFAPGALSGGKVQINENAAMMTPQFSVMNQTESEIMQITGINNEAYGYPSNATSGIAIQERKAQASTMTSPLFASLRTALNRLGYLLCSHIQSRWTQERVIRVTDRITGIEKFIAVNQRIMQPDGSFYIKNDVTKGKFDIVISQAPQSTTVRERNLNLLMEWVKQSPPEIIPHIVLMAFELSDLPNKEILLTRIKPLLGVDDDQTDPEAIRQMLAQQKQQQEQAAQIQGEMAQTELEIKKARETAEIQKLQAETARLMAEVERIKKQLQLESIKAGADIAHKESIHADKNHQPQ